MSEDGLGTKIRQRLNKRAYYVVFEPELESSWPRHRFDGSHRRDRIERFAEARGWHVSVVEVEAGARAIFRKA